MCIVDVCVRWMVVRRWVQMLKELVGILLKLELSRMQSPKPVQSFVLYLIEWSNVVDLGVMREAVWCYMVCMLT